VPLHISPGLTSICRNWVNVFKLVGDVAGPGDVVWVDVDLCVLLTVGSSLPELESIIEETLGNKSTGNSREIIGKVIVIHALLLIQPEVFDLDDWVAVIKLSDFLVLSVELFVVS